MLFIGELWTAAKPNVHFALELASNVYGTCAGLSYCAVSYNKTRQMTLIATRQMTLIATRKLF